MSSVDPTIKLEKMDKVQSDNVDIVLKSVDNNRIIVQDSNADEDVKTTEYFLNMDDNVITEENHETHFVTVEDENLENGDAQFVSVEVEDDQIILQDKDVILWNEICRICANGSDRFIPIFSGEGLEHDFQNKIHTYLPFQVNEDDNLPHQVCYNCAATLLAWHDLFKGCIDAQQRLVELQSKLKDQYYNDSNIEESNGTVLEVHNIKSKESLAQVKNVSSAEIQHVGEISSETERSKEQLRTCASFKDFQKAFKPAHPAIKARKKSQTVSKPMKKRAGRVVKKKSVKKSKVKIMSENTKQTLENSDISSFSSVKLESTDVVMDEDIDDEDDVPENNDDANDEDYEMTASSEIAKAKRSRKRSGNTSAISNLECKQCNKKFRMYNSYQIHMRIHTGEKPYTCHICGKQFGQTGSLYYHLKHVHGGVKNHACDICGRCFAMKTAMEDHRRIHTGERPYICDSCGKTFKTKASLYTHSKIHTNEYPFKCSYCKKLFRWKQQMISHLTTHTGEKNHICDICGKGFGVKNELTRHRRTHSSDKPFTCQKCGVSFGQKRYLTNHNRTRHKTKTADN